MITLQVLNKVLQTGDPEILLKNSLTVDYFVGYETEYNFIMDHYNRYGNIPDRLTFAAAFSNFEIVDVFENDRYLLDTLFEEHLYYKSVSIVQTVAELLKSNSQDAVEYLRGQMTQLQLPTAENGIDIIAKAEDRLTIYEQKKSAEDPWYIATGFEELDDVIHGWAKGEEFAVIFARTGQGKSWVLAKTLMHAWQIGNRVGYISPEMSAIKIGYRFDTLFKHFSNRNLVWGNDEPDYPEYIKELAACPNPFMVATPLDFQKKITISKLRQFCLSNKLDILGVDGITYLTDERSKRGDNKTITLTNISEDLMDLSLELGIPILVVVQSNRGGIKEEDSGTPELEHIRDSDGIAHNASKVIALRQTGAGLEFGIKKHRDGAAGGKLIYNWDIDRGEFQYIPSTEDAVQPGSRQKKIDDLKGSFKDGKDVF